MSDPTSIFFRLGAIVVISLIVMAATERARAAKISHSVLRIIIGIIVALWLLGTLFSQFVLGN